MKALASLQCWAGRSGLPISIVEPAISGSTITGNIVQAAITFRDLFDLDHLNAVSKDHGYTNIITRDQFFYGQSSKYIIFVLIEVNWKGLIWPKVDSGDGGGMCYSKHTPHYPLLSLLKRRGYCIVKVVSVDSQMLSVEEMHEILDEQQYYTYFQQVEWTLVYTRRL